MAFATPFASGSGRRVFSGAFRVEETPIGAYLRRVTPLRGARVYLIDSAGAIVASNGSDLTNKKTLRQADPKLARALTRSSASETSAGYQYASRRVGGTPWRLLLSVPKEQLFTSVQGPGLYLTWILWGAFVLVTLASVLLVDNLVTSRRELRQANDDLDRLARIDGLTGLNNRRQSQDSLEAALATARRHGQPLSVLMIDVDHFKQINDLHGHHVGDQVLRFVAQTVGSALRTEDVIGRWGGEEFLALLPSTPSDGAQEVARRLRAAIASTPAIVDARLRAVVRHAFRNSLIPVVTIIGLQFGAVLTGTIITETIFAWPGVGRLLIQAINFRDYPLVQGCILFISITYVVMNLLTDLTYGFLDPRIRYD